MSRHLSRRLAVWRPSTAASRIGLRAGVIRSMSTGNDYVKIVDVSPRDGLQNEKELVSTETKIELISRLVRAGVPAVEVTSFVSPKWVPQMADSTQVLGYVLEKLATKSATEFPVLTPNLKGLEGAIAAADKVGAKVPEVAIFAACSEGFSKKNLNKSIAESLAAFEPVVEKAKEQGIKLRGYLSTVVGCPYDGKTDPVTVAKLAAQLMDMGCYEVSLGDTIGVATPKHIERLLDEVLMAVPAENLAIHAHDTYGQGVANVVKAIEMGIRVVDASTGGLGGCPYAKGASGNVSTEDVVYTLHGLGISTGIDLASVAATGAWISEQLGRPNSSRAGKAIVSSGQNGPWSKL